MVTHGLKLRLRKLRRQYSKKMKENLPVEVLYVIIAAIGGGARYLSLYINGERFRLSMLCANLLLSGFSGFMFSLFGGSLGLESDIIYVMAGIGGFMGTETVKFIASKLKKDL
jgi:hypothetical protein